MSEAAPFVVLAQRQVKPEHLDAFLKADDALMRDASRAPGFRTVYVLQTLEDPTLVSHFELWEGQEAHDAYVMGDGHEGFEQRIAELVEHVHDPRHYRVFRRYDAQPHEGRETARPRASGGRLPEIGPEGIPDDVERLLERLPQLRFFRVAAQAQAAFTPFIRLADALLNRGALHPRLRELAILAVAHFEEADYERVQHERLAHEAGVTPQQTAALRAGELEAPIFNHNERLVLRFVASWWAHKVVDDDLFGAAAERFSPGELTELLLLCGYYLTAARLMTNAGLAPEPPAEKRFDLSDRMEAQDAAI